MLEAVTAHIGLVGALTYLGVALFLLGVAWLSDAI